MGVTNVRLHWNGSTGSRKKAGSEYLAVYRVTTDSPRDQTAVICDHFRDAGKLPYIDSPYEYANDRDDGALCASIDPQRQMGSQTDWEVTLRYATPSNEKKEEEDPGGSPELDPTQWLESWDVGSTQITVPVEKAKYRGGMKGESHRLWGEGREGPIVNSAFDTYVPPPEHEITIRIYRRSMYSFEYESSISDTYEGKVNRNAITVVRPSYGLRIHANQYQLKVKSIGAVFGRVNGYLVWHHHWEFWVNPLGCRGEYRRR